MVRWKTLIFGCGAMGHEVAVQLLERGIHVCLYSDNPDEVANIQAKGLDAALVDHTDDDKLREIGIGDWVETLFCLFSDEPQNLFVTLSARALDPQLKIICVCESATSGAKLVTAGASKVIDPYEISGQRVHELIARPYMVELLESTVFGRYVDIAEVEIPAGSSLSGTPLDDLQLARHYNLIVLGVVDLELGQALIFCNNGINHLMDNGDLLVVIGPREEIARLREDIQANRLAPADL
jgi:voltage-gated potassium channel